MKKIIIALLILLSLISFAEAQEKDDFDIVYEVKNGEIYIEDTSKNALETLFSKIGYSDYYFMPDMVYPAIFIKKLPKDFWEIEDESYRNRLFIKMLAPVAIKVNEDIFKERKEIFKIGQDFEINHELMDSQKDRFEELAKKYDVFTPFKGYRRTLYILDELKKRIDVVPPSMLVAAAAIESNWGTSRPAKEANALYKEKVWYGEEKGLPSQEDTDDDYEFKVFDSIYDAMYSYAVKINSGVDFDYMRTYRAEYRHRERPVSGRSLAHAMMQVSLLKNYAGILDYTITFYEMMNLDIAKLMRLPDDAEN